ncbi:MAG: molybdate ABC transporter substrate-binding protein [Clostridiales Family XIII bacterium]|jgi:molybdate transport system substrate-binding protein|nr:molybdate ABC transporter substrate-binding protein [Clostridiales Family XIII bacterium]
MKKMRVLAFVLAAMAMMFLFAGCTGNDAGSSAAGSSAAGSSAAVEPEPEEPAEPATSDIEGDIMIAAAASLENALADRLIPLFNETYPNITVKGTYDSSGKLQTQIEEGLEADLFFSAALKQMDALTEEGLIDEASRKDLLLNEVVLITSPDSGTAVTGFANITDAETIAIGDPESVPAGQYAQEVLTSLGVWDAVNAKASLGTNVTEVLTWVAEGSAEVGVVYATDAASLPDEVVVLESAPADTLQTPVVYPVALLARTPEDQKAAAQAFLDFLTGDEAMVVFEEYGFKPY